MRRHLRAAIAVVLLAGGCAAPDGEPGVEAEVPRRLVVLAPNLTEMVYALGLGERVVGVGDHGDWPPEVREKPRLGGLLDPHLEAIVELEPDLAVLLPGHRDLAGQLSGLGIESLVVEVETVDDVLTAVRTIADRLGEPERGAVLEAELRRQLAPRRVAGSPSVLLILDRPQGSLSDFYTAAAGTFFHQLLDRLGAVNIAAESRVFYPQLGLDTVVEAAPQVIIELRGRPLTEAAKRALIDDWSRIPMLPAVRNGCVRVVDGDFTVIPGPRLPRLYEALHRAIAECPAAASAVSVGASVWGEVGRIHGELGTNSTTCSAPAGGEAVG